MIDTKEIFNVLVIKKILYKETKERLLLKIILVFGKAYILVKINHPLNVYSQKQSTMQPGLDWAASNTMQNHGGSELPGN